MVKYHGDKKYTAAELIAKAKQETGTRPAIAPAAGELGEGQIAFEDFELKLMDQTHRIYFNADRSSIKDQHQSELDSIVQLLNKYDVLNIEIAGYASKDGNPRYNLQLSQKRALIVLDYFLKMNIEEDRIVARGYGSITDDEGDPEEHRRAEVRIVSTVRE